MGLKEKYAPVWVSLSLINKADMPNNEKWPISKNLKKLVNLLEKRIEEIEIYCKCESMFLSKQMTDKQKDIDDVENRIKERNQKAIQALEIIQQHSDIAYKFLSEFLDNNRKIYEK